MSDGDDTDELSDDEKQSMCERCGGGCCSFRGLSISFGSHEDYDSIREYLLHEFENSSEQMGHQLLRADGSTPDMDWYDDGGELYFECNHLTDDGRCGIYEDRPGMCREFECAALEGEMSLMDFLRSHARDPRELEKMELEDVSERVDSALGELGPIPE